MRSKHIYLTLVILLLTTLFVSSGQVALAEPAPSKLVVNHETQQCAIIFGGDECIDCFPPEGWEVLGWSYQAECPENYTFTEVEENCIPFKDEFCCTEGHSGAAGACEDMVINRATFKCAFVDDIHACKLPLGWSAKPEDIPVNEWECPGLYGWTDDVDCRSGSTNPGDEETDSGSGLIPVQCGGAIFGGLLIPFLGLVFFRRKNSTDIGSF